MGPFCFAWTFLSPPCLFPTSNLSKKFSWTWRSLRERRTSLVDTIVVQLFKSVDGEWTSAGNVLQHLYSQQKQVKLHITSPSLTGPASHLHSDQTSWATKWKQNRDREGQRRETERKVFYRCMLSRWRQMWSHEFHWLGNRMDSHKVSTFIKNPHLFFTPQF